MSPKTDPRLQNKIECHSSLILIQKIVNAAQLIPIKNEQILSEKPCMTSRREGGKSSFALVLYTLTDG